jgi:hypothetical protein
MLCTGKLESYCKNKLLNVKKCMPNAVLYSQIWHLKLQNDKNYKTV